jgi:hypothetical protein
MRNLFDKNWFLKSVYKDIQHLTESPFLGGETMIQPNIGNFSGRGSVIQRALAVQRESLF